MPKKAIKLHCVRVSRLLFCCVGSLEKRVTHMVGNFHGVLILVTFMLDLAVMKLPPTKMKHTECMHKAWRCTAWPTGQQSTWLYSNHVSGAKCKIYSHRAHAFQALGTMNHNIKTSIKTRILLWTTWCSLYNLPTFWLDAPVILRAKVKWHARMLMSYRRGWCACMPMWLGSVQRSKR